MSHTYCPRCNKSGVSNGANRQSYPNGASYFRSVHTTSECDAFIAARDARIEAEQADTAAREAWRTEGARLLALYGHGSDELLDHWAVYPA